MPEIAPTDEMLLHNEWGLLLKNSPGPFVCQAHGGFQSLLFNCFRGRNVAGAWHNVKKASQVSLIFFPLPLSGPFGSMIMPMKFGIGIPPLPPFHPYFFEMALSLCLIDANFASNISIYCGH